MATLAPLLIVGCGYLGRVVGRLALAQGRTVFALTRSRPEELASLGLTPIVGNVLDPESLQKLRVLPQLGGILYAVGLDRRQSADMRTVYVHGVSEVSRVVTAPRWVYISSTSVYGQSDGSTVTEGSATEPLEPSGGIVLEAEAALVAQQPHATRLRFAGIYGPGRILRRDSLLRGEPLRIDPDHYLNLIHVEDGARAALACLDTTVELGRIAGQVFNISDDEAGTRREIYEATAKALGVGKPQFLPPDPPERETHRRISNQLAKQTLGWQPQFVSYREGLAAAVVAERA